MDMAQLIALTSVDNILVFLSILTASLIHRVVQSGSQPMTVASSQSMSVLMCCVNAVIFCSDCDCFLYF